MRKMLSFLMGATIGGLVGATFALLFAPSSGIELQSKMKTNFTDLTNEIRQAATDRRKELTLQLEALRKG